MTFRVVLYCWGSGFSWLYQSDCNAYWRTDRLGWGMPHFSRMAGDVTTVAATRRKKLGAQKCVYIGAGAIACLRNLDFTKLVKPVGRGLAGALAASRARKAGKADTLPITEARYSDRHCRSHHARAAMLPIGWLLGLFRQSVAGPR
jgi:uncharacterized oligopeptide transporter (OPT) family protein